MKAPAYIRPSGLILRRARLLNGVDGTLRDNVDILIQNGTIRQIQPASTNSHPSSGNKTAGTQDMDEIDCSGLTLLPGLVDCHVHLALDGVDFEGSLRRWENPSALQAHLADTLRNTFKSGVLAVRDGGDRCRAGLLAGRRLGGAPGYPLVAAAGEALRKRTMYGSFLGRGLESTGLRDTVRNIAAAGASQVKVLVSGIVSFREYGRVGPLQFTRQELELLVSEAHCLGLKVMAHASSEEGTSLAVQCGVDSLEHGYFISEETLARMAVRGIAWVPTLIPVAAQLREPLRQHYDSARLSVIAKTLSRQQRMVQVASRLGVVLGVGTDAGASGVRHGFSYIEELKLLEESGLSPAGVLRCATSNGARILGLESIMGRAAPGMPATLIGVRGNPADDLEMLKNLTLVLSP